MVTSGLPGAFLSARLRRRARLIGVVALPYACSVYTAPDTGAGVGAQAGSGGKPTGPMNTAAGDAPRGGMVNGGSANPAAGTNPGGSAAAGGMTGVIEPGGDGASGAAGEGGAPVDAPSGGSGSGTAGAGAGGKSSGGGGAGGTAGHGGTGGAAGHGGAGAGGTGGAGGTSGATTGGAGMAGATAITGLVTAYPFESASGTTLADTSGHGLNASLANGAGGAPVGFSFSAGVVGNAITLTASDQGYVSLPKGIVSKLSALTIASWVKLKSGTAFQRIFDFGVDTNTFMYLVNAGSSGSVRLRMASTTKNQVVEGTAGLPVGKWVHVAVTIGDSGLAIYVDGAQVGQQAPATMRPADLGDTGNNYIGRSPFSQDPYLDGQVDEFRIYDHVLSAAEIGMLAKGQ